MRIRGVLLLSYLFGAIENNFCQSSIQNRIEPHGIYFEKSLSWAEIKNKARIEKKYIFVDVFATWCMPCKKMEKEIYNLETVSALVNAKFISVKVQMDTSAGDNQETKSWYTTAHDMKEEYRIWAYPTFLFFSPDGNLVHKSIGYKDEKNFIALANDAVNPDRQYYTLLNTYTQGRLNYTLMPYLAVTASTLKEDEIAQEVAQGYTEHYLVHLSDNDLFTKENIEFIARFTVSSRERGFLLFYNHPELIDQRMKNGEYAEGLIDYIIAKEDINPVLWPSGKGEFIKPDWAKMSITITREYNKIWAERTVIQAKIRWYGWKKDWPAYTRNTVLLVKRYGSTMSNFELNNDAWDAIFRRSNDKAELQAAAAWMKKVVDKEPDASYIDTYANLLYKLGRKEALSWEEKAIKLTPSDKSIYRNLENMKKDKPTWSID